MADETWNETWDEIWDEAWGRGRSVKQNLVERLHRREQFPSIRIMGSAGSKPFQVRNNAFFNQAVQRLIELQQSFPGHAVDAVKTSAERPYAHAGCFVCWNQMVNRGNDPIAQNAVVANVRGISKKGKYCGQFQTPAPFASRFAHSRPLRRSEQIVQINLTD